jgi:oxalate decarboxylase
MTETKHLRSLREKTPSFASDSGSIARIDVNDFPVLKRLSLRRLLLSPRGVREPHWHANANELGYVLAETILSLSRAAIARGIALPSRAERCSSYRQSGALHHIENIGEEQEKSFLASPARMSEDFGLSGTFGAFTDAVLGNTTGLPAAAFAGVKRSARDTFIGSRTEPARPEQQARHINPHKYALEAAQPPIVSAAGPRIRRNRPPGPSSRTSLCFPCGLLTRECAKFTGIPKQQKWDMSPEATGA